MNLCFGDGLINILFFCNVNRYLPKAGWVTLVMTEKPVIKVCTFTLIILLVYIAISIY